MAHAAESAVVATVWSHVEYLLSQDGHVLHAFLSHLSSLLPDLASLSDQELPQLAKVHLGSARNLMHTLRLMAPEAFHTDASQPDLERLDNSLVNMATTLIDLQLFHLCRASTLTARSRALLAQKAAATAAANDHTEAATIGRASSSTCSSSCAFSCGGGHGGAGGGRRNSSISSSSRDIIISSSSSDDDDGDDDADDMLLSMSL